MNVRKLGLASCVLGAATLLGAGATSADAASVTYGFTRITSNSSDSVASQLFVDVSDEARLGGPAVGGNQVRFSFRNEVGLASSITGVYFDDGTLLGIAGIYESSGVDFSQGASPGNLPGHNNITPAFETTAGFLADSDPPVSHNGVNASSEWLDIIFELKGTQTYADVLNAFTLGGADSGLRIGLHVQAHEDGESDSYVNGPVVPTPTAALGGLVLLGGSLLRRRAPE